ncbi:MAG: anhydro-N-acetylmuramic acid kinase [Bacteroidetes bacterium]|nr:anhydro-N-acetylmuramic acid kinase [Bacteroidota bacterium]
MKTTYTAIGLMSGTSLDGLDVALCSFTKNKKDWSYHIIDAKTYTYNKQWKERLEKAPVLDAQSFWKLHVDFGVLSAQKVNAFLKNKKQRIDVIASHGHTVFHQPQNNFTCQIGDGASIAAHSGIQTLCDFRSTDVALGGQGAPLVPIGDALLFSSFDACLNIGGIANISFTQNKKRIAFDVCPANMVFNFYAQQVKKTYDKGGLLAKKGVVCNDVLKKLNALPYYKKQQNKSLGREWVEQHFISRIEEKKLSVYDKLATSVEHSALQIATVLNKNKIKNVLITGGGAYNTFLIEQIKKHSACRLVIPNDNIIQYKEALIFAFLGVLRMRNEVNCLKGVTGARSNSISGACYQAPPR